MTSQPLSANLQRPEFHIADTAVLTQPMQQIA